MCKKLGAVPSLVWGNKYVKENLSILREKRNPTAKKKRRGEARGGYYTDLQLHTQHASEEGGRGQSRGYFLLKYV